MSTIAPKDKAFLDIKLVQECMDNQSKMVSIAFGDWLQFNYQPHAEAGYWYDHHNDPLQYKPPTSTTQLYNKFIESITK